MYPNTAHDLEVVNFEPVLQYFPQQKSELFKLLSVVLAPLVWLIDVDLTILKRFVS